MSFTIGRKVIYKGRKEKQNITILRYFLCTKVKVEEIPKPLFDRSVLFLSTFEIRY